MLMSQHLWAGAIQVLGTDDATTCHIVILRHTGTATTFTVSITKQNEVINNK